MVDRVFITSEGLVRALNFIQKDWTFKEWGIKSVISSRTPRGVGRFNAEKIRLREDQEERAPRDTNPPKEHETQLFRKKAAPLTLDAGRQFIHHTTILPKSLALSLVTSVHN